MGLGKKWKRALGGVAKIAQDVTGSKAVGKGVALGLTAFGGIGATGGLSDINKEETSNKNAIAQAEMQAQQTSALNAQVAETSRQRLMAEEDLKRQEEELKKRTTFAGSSMQSINERRKLLGA
jgi:Flp pilus assembly protein TadB